MRRWIALFWMLLFLVPAACDAGLTPVKISSPDGKPRQTFKAELALTPAEQEQGLMFRKELGANRGMLFVFPPFTHTPFWMKNTLIPLDMVFIGGDRRIVSIVENAEPQTTTPREAAGPYQYVLEIEGGRSKELGIQSGDKVDFDLSKKKATP